MANVLLRMQPGFLQRAIGRLIEGAFNILPEVSLADLGKQPKKIDDESPYVIVLDPLVERGMDTIPLIAQYRPGTPIICVLSGGNPMVAARCVQLGATDAVSTDITDVMLIEAITCAAEGRPTPKWSLTRKHA